MFATIHDHYHALRSRHSHNFPRAVETAQKGNVLDGKRRVEGLQVDRERGSAVLARREAGEIPEVETSFAGGEKGNHKMTRRFGSNVRVRGGIWQIAIVLCVLCATSAVLMGGPIGTVQTVHMGVA